MAILNDFGIIGEQNGSIPGPGSDGAGKQHLPDSSILGGAFFASIIPLIVQCHIDEWPGFCLACGAIH